MPYATATDGIRLYYSVHGHGDTAIFLLHGMGSSDTWRLLLEHLDLRTFKIVTSDWRGHGASEAGGSEGFTYPQLNADIITILNAADVHAGIVVGFSGGCKNAIWLAAEAPSRVLGLLLIAPPGLGEVPLPRETMKYFADYIEQRKTVPPEFEAWFTEKIGEAKQAAVASIVTTSRRALEQSIELWIYTSVMEYATRVTQSVVVIAARRDIIYGPEFQRQTTLAALPRATMDVFECGHFIPAEEPVQLARALERFYRSLGSD